jgi:ABC-type uncharacterized transport system involved in gliding motility auxiliary subunit
MEKKMKLIDKLIGGIAPLAMLFALVYYSITNLWSAVNWITLGLGLLGVVYFLYVYFSKREKAISTRSLQYGSNILLQMIMVLAIIALLAFITTRQHFRSDWTKNKLYSLAEQTENILSGLDKKVKILAFFKKDEQSSARDLLDEYAYRSANFEYEFIDPKEKPQIARQYEIKNYGTLVVEVGTRREMIESLTESNLTNALMKVTREQEKAVYFLKGHGERSITDEGPEGFKQAAEAIRKENYQVQELNLVLNIAQRKGIPDSCTILVVVNPRSNFFPTELDTIKSYLDRGSKAFILLDPEHQDDIAQFLSGYRITVGKDLVIDASGMGQLVGAGVGMPLVMDYDQSIPITKGFGVLTFYPYASSVTPMEDKGEYDIRSLLKTSANSWAEVDYKTTSNEITFDESKDQAGPVTIGVLVEKSIGEKKLSLAVFGDSDFAGNGYWNNQGNADLFLNTINYLAEEEDLITIRPKEVDDRRVTLTKANVMTIFYLVVIAIPVLVVIGGIIFYIKRSR